MDCNLRAEHGLTIHDYEVLLALSRAEDRRLRRVDLAERVVLTQSGITRLLAGLEEAGLVRRANCASDGRVVYAELTEEGLDRLRAAARTHVRDIEELFASRLSREELDVMDAALGRVLADPADGAETCEPAA